MATNAEVNWFIQVCLDEMSFFLKTEYWKLEYQIN